MQFNRVCLAILASLIVTIPAACGDPGLKSPGNGGAGGGGGTGGSGGQGGATGGGGSSEKCMDDEDCAPSNDECIVPKCTNGSCAYSQAPVGTLCREDDVCDVIGNCIECLPSAEGCIGGCQSLCNGAKCSGDSDCQSKFCADGVCCAEECGDTCKSCGIPGAEGQCVSVPRGMVDDSCVNAGEVCDGASPSGACESLGPNERAVGERCDSPGDTCYNDKCIRGFCRLQDGNPCVDDVACEHNLCLSGTCEQCDGSRECNDGSECSSNFCTAPLGEPCGAPGDCQGGSCLNGLCKQTIPDACADDLDCSSGYCVMNLCAACVGDANCTSNACNLGNCLLPIGAYCVDPNNCASAKCSGFPAKCE